MLYSSPPEGNPNNMRNWYETDDEFQDCTLSLCYILACHFQYLNISILKLLIYFQFHSCICASPPLQNTEQKNTVPFFLISSCHFALGLNSKEIMQIKFGSVKLAKVYMKRVAAELQSKGPLDKDTSMDYMLLQGVRFAFRIHQVCLILVNAVLLWITGFYYRWRIDW